MTAVLLALASAALFGTMTVAVRVGIRGVEAGTATLATVLPALAVALVAAGIHHDLHGIWPFLLAGLLAPGTSQILFTRRGARGRGVADVGHPGRRTARGGGDRGDLPR